MVTYIGLYLIITLSNFTSVDNRYFTEQFPDLLVIDSDTFYLVSFPMASAQFKLKDGMSPPNPSFNTGCWRGYIATWTVKNDSLYLTNMRACSNTYLDMVNYLYRYEVEHEIKNSQLFAYWYSANLVTADVFFAHPKDKPKYLCSDDDGYAQNDTIRIRFESGIIQK